MVAMMAKTNSVPVVVCCETYKFSDGVMVDGFSKNELGDKHFCLYRGNLTYIVCSTVINYSKKLDRSRPCTFYTSGDAESFI
jgi:translation initiation factor 2B subunit (eIF-2B alpha/beta/delta family)